MWTMVGHCVVRTTGFSADHIDRLRGAKSASAVDALLSAEREIADVLGAARLDRVRRQVDSGWTGATRHPLEDRYRSARCELAEVADRDAGEARDWLAAFAENPRFREVLAATNPGLLRDLGRGRLSARLGCQVASYVQRLSVKNETVGFFGPINYGRLDPNGPDELTVSWQGPDVLLERSPALSAALTTQVVDAVAFAEPVWPWLVLCRVDGLPRPGGAPSLLDVIDGRTTLRVLADGLGADAVVGAARELVSRGLARHQLQPPSTCVNPLDFLLRRLAGVPGSAALANWVAELVGIVNGFSTADAEGRAELQRTIPALVADLSGGHVISRAPSREGQFYADRLPVREECLGTLRVTIGGRHATEFLGRLTPALDLLCRFAARRRDLARAALGARLGVRRVPFWRLAAKAGDWPLPVDEELNQVLAQAARHQRDGDGVLDLAAVDLSGVLPADPGSAVCSADIMVAAESVQQWRDGAHELVIGDVHDTALLTDWALRFHPDAPAIRTEVALATAAAQGDRPLVSVLAGRRTGIPPLDHPGPVVELGGISGQPNPWSLDLTDLVVESDGRQARLVSTALGGEVLLHNGELDTITQTAFGALRARPLRLRLGRHTPRLCCGAAVVQRRSWLVPAASFASLARLHGDTARLMVEASRIWGQHQLLGDVFVALPGVRKPVFAAADSPLLLGALARLATRTEGDAVVSEVRPALNRLWLAGSHGRHTAELRCVFVRHPARSG